MSELLGSVSAEPAGADPSTPRVERLWLTQAIPGATHLRGVSWKSADGSHASLDEAMGLPNEPVLAAFYSQRQQAFGKASVALPLWTPAPPVAPTQEKESTAAVEPRPEKPPSASPQLAMAESIQPASAPPASAADEAPASPAPPDNLDRPEWIVNVATYADVDLARQHAQRLITEGFKAAVREEKVRGRSSYRVVIESLSTESAAQSALTHLADRYGERAAWVMRKR